MSAIMAAALAIEAHRHDHDGWPERVAERFHADHPETHRPTVEDGHEGRPDRRPDTPAESRQFAHDVLDRPPAARPTAQAG